MKKSPIVCLLAVLGLVMTSGNVAAERLEAGTIEVGGNFMYDADTAFGSRTDLGLMGGYYVAYGWLVGGEIQMVRDDYTSINSLLATVERSFEIGSADAASPFVPYAGLGLGYAKASYEGSDDMSGLLLSGKVGMKLMLTGDLAVDLGLILNFSSDDVYYDDDGPSNRDICIRLGLRTFLF